MIILNIFQGMWACGMDSSGLGNGPLPDCCEHCNESFCSAKGKQFGN